MKILLLSVAVCIYSQGALLADEDKKNAADNATANQPDRAGEEEAPDQSNDPADLKLAADIRKSVTQEDDLSAAAKKIKITTSGGSVWLRGTVRTQREKLRVHVIAVALAEAGNVNDLLEVAP